MLSPSSKLPDGVSMSPVARAAFDVLAGYTAFPWPVLSSQCKRAGYSAERLTKEQLRTLIPLLAAGVGRFTSPEKEIAVKRELVALADRRD
jgi:hypothetical protein